MRNTPGLDANTTATKMLSWFGSIWTMPQRIGVEDQAGIDPAADHQRQPEQQIEPVRPALEAGAEQRREEDDREQEEQPGHAVGDRRLHDARRHQQVEQQDHREGQHEIGQERQDRVDAAAVVAGRQAERDADHQREGGRRRRDDQHDLAAIDHAAEHVAGELVAAEQVDLLRDRLDRAGQRVLHDRRPARADRTARSVAAKIAVNSQKKQIATPAMPTPLSNSWP